MLTEIEIANFRSCGDTQLKLTRGISALIGRNGVGKTNLLKAIEWIAKSAVSTREIEFSGTPSDRAVGGKLVLQLEGVVYEYQLHCVRSVDHARRAPIYSVQESLSRDDGSGTAKAIFAREGEQVVSPLRAEAIRVRRAAPAIGAISALLPEQDSLREATAPVARFLAGVHYYLLGDRSDRATDFVLDKEYQEWRGKYLASRTPTASVGFRLLFMCQEAPDLMDELRALVGPQGLGLVAIGDVTTVELPSAPSAGHDSAPDKVYFFSFAPLEGMGGAGDARNFSDLSAGTRRALRLLVSMLFDRRTTMLIEEPEDSIHPGLLRKLIDILRSYSETIQVLFATHSTEVLDMLRPEEVFLISAPNGRTVARSLGPDEIVSAKAFLEHEGALSDFLESLEECSS